ncbi:MAG: S24/S26 family peptidase [Bacteroidales bacterium]|nr:S24/S26 family peptidase [Bacteroidales bacterium]
MEHRVLPNEILLEEVGALLGEGREVAFTPKGTSMLPFIRGGKDTVTLKKLEQVEVGDIVLVRLADERYVLHRVIGIDGDALLLMGDGNVYGTESCTLANVMGTVVLINKHKPSRGRIWRWLKPVRRYLLGIYRRLI